MDSNWFRSHTGKIWKYLLKNECLDLHIMKDVKLESLTIYIISYDHDNDPNPCKNHNIKYYYRILSHRNLLFKYHAKNLQAGYGFLMILSLFLIFTGSFKSVGRFQHAQS